MEKKKEQKKGLGKGTGDVAREIEWCMLANEEVLKAFKQFQLVQ